MNAFHLDMHATGYAPPAPLLYTTFRDLSGTAAQPQQSTWAQFVEMLHSPPEYSSKQAMPLLKLAIFGANRTHAGSLRHNGNVVTVTGIEGDYDGGEVSARESIERLEERGIRALVYTSPSSRPDAPRWRVLCPLGEPCDPSRRDQLVKRLDTVLGGILARESYTLSQAFYFGRIPGGHYECQATFDDPSGGLCIDELVDLEPAASSDGGAQALREPTEGDPLARFEVPRYRQIGEAIKALGRKLVDSEGRREYLKSYIAAKSHQGLDAKEIRRLADGFIAEHFDPRFPVDSSQVDRFITWTTERDAGVRRQLDVMERARVLHDPLSDSLRAPGKLDPSAGRIRIASAYPPPREYIFASTVTPGTVCAIAGSGGSSKTMLAMQACIAAASGLSLGPVQVAEGASLLILGEEDMAERDRRLGGICEHLKANHALVERRVRCFPAAADNIQLTQVNQRGFSEETGFADEIVEHAQALAKEAGVPVRMIVIDHARLVMGADPNAAEHVTRLTKVLNWIAQQTGAAVFLLAHSPKSVIAKSGAEVSAADIAGSGAFVDNARSAFMLHTMRPDDAKQYAIEDGDHTKYVQLVNVKANHAPSGAVHWFKRVVLPNWSIAVLEPVMLYPATKGPINPREALMERIVDVVRSKPGGVTRRHLRSLAGKDNDLRASEKRIHDAVEYMLKDGPLTERSPTAEEKRMHKLKPQTRSVLVVE